MPLNQGALGTWTAALQQCCNIDNALGDGLSCPACGSLEFETVQVFMVPMKFIRGRWDPVDEDSFDTSSGETLSVSCMGCGRLIWDRARGLIVTSFAIPEAGRG